jgi:hypothetical protein
VVGWLLVLAALAVLGVAWRHSGVRLAPVRPGETLAGELGTSALRSLPGRLSKPPDRELTLGEGPDSLSLLVAGRPMAIEGTALVFPSVEQSQSRVGRAIVDVVDMEGDVARLKADVLAEGPPLTPSVRLHSLIDGPSPDPQVALMLMGSTGRYVALILEGAGAPLALEWALGERRGKMLGQDSPAGLTHLEMEVDADGVLRAYVGTKKDRRAIGEPLVIGREWQKQFGEGPRSAVGCLEGTCRVEGLSYSVKQAPPLNPATTVAAATPTPRPPAVPARPVTKPPPPVKKPPAKTPPPPSKGGKKPR